MYEKNDNFRGIRNKLEQRVFEMEKTEEIYEGNEGRGVEEYFSENP